MFEYQIRLLAKVLGPDDLGGSSIFGCFLVVMERLLVVSCGWFWQGLRQRDKNIYLPCIGWVLLDGTVIGRVIVQGQ